MVLPAALAVAIALVGACAGCGTQGREPTRGSAATVERVGDGDTLELANGTRVRLVQIDAPEVGEGECYSREALRELRRLAPHGARVELDTDPRLDDVDRFGRLLRYVSIDGTDLNVELVRRGAAAPYFFRDVRGTHAEELLDVASSARQARRGMWGVCRVVWTRDRPVDTRSG
jgi:micrococcal nuclease